MPIKVVSEVEVEALRQFYEAHKALCVATKEAAVAQAVAVMNAADEALALIHNTVAGTPVRRRVIIVDA